MRTLDFTTGKCKNRRNRDKNYGLYLYFLDCRRDFRLRGETFCTALFRSPAMNALYVDLIADFGFMKIEIPFLNGSKYRMLYSSYNNKYGVGSNITQETETAF